MKTIHTSHLLVIALSAFAIMGAPCPALNGEEPECEDDEDCDDDEECNDGECEALEDDGPSGLDAKAMQYCIESYTCAEDPDPAATCEEQAQEAEDDPVNDCVLAACAPETGVLYDCVLANSECVDGVLDSGLGEGGACEATIQPYMDCYNESGCADTGEGEGEGEGEGVCAGFIGAGDGCDCGCGEHDPDCDTVGGGCDTAGCCTDPPQGGCEYCN